MLVATAGHIDHGKTSLIRALTGVETDRLPEERARGISIDLGFAYWTPQDGHAIGFVDVPGHERFVRNMLAGVGAVDFALLVVAADDGVRPQTVEHVQILDLLGITQGIVVITKCDRSTTGQVQAVRRQAATLLESTGMAGAAMVEVSCASGAGIEQLRALLHAADRAHARRACVGKNFRLAVDRAFSVAGAGTVVSGTVLDGTLRTGERLMLSPRGVEGRVRAIQSDGRSVTEVRAGERCAINLAGIELAQVHRGDWLVTPAMHCPSSRIEVRLNVLDGNRHPLKHHAPVRLHLGTADIPARVLIPAQAAIPPGGNAIVQLAMEHPTLAANGDRFVLRDQSGKRTLGGGSVIDPFVTGDRRHQAARAPISAALQHTDPAQALAGLLAIAGHEVDTQQFERCFNLEADAALDLYRQADAVLLGNTQTLALPAERIGALGAETVAVVAAFHREQPDAIGITARELKSRLSAPISAQAFLFLQKELTEKHQLELAGSLIKLAGHAASFSTADRVLWRKLLPTVEHRGVLAFTARDLVVDLGTGESAVRALLYRACSNGEVWRIAEERFVLRTQAAALAASAAVLARTMGCKGFTAAQFRDAIGSGRTMAIHLLEFFDNIGVTSRDGNLRRMRGDYELVVGCGAPYRAPPKQAADLRAGALLGA